MYLLPTCLLTLFPCFACHEEYTLSLLFLLPIFMDADSILNSCYLDYPKDRSLSSQAVFK